MPITRAKPRIVHRDRATIAARAGPAPSGADRPRLGGKVTAGDLLDLLVGTVPQVIARAQAVPTSAMANHTGSAMRRIHRAKRREPRPRR